MTGRVALLASMLLAAMLLAACAAPDATFTCQSTTHCGDLGNVMSCCTDAHCEYRVDDGTSFACQGTECTNAHAALALYCAPHCPDAAILPDAWAPHDAGPDAALDADLDGGGLLDAEPCVR